MSVSPPRRRIGREPAWTPRQREVLDLLVGGLTNGEIASRLGISLDGAKWHVSEIITKLGVDSRIEAADYWRERNSARMCFSRVVHGIASASGLKWAAGAAAGLGVIAVAAGIILALNHGGDDLPAVVLPEGTPTFAAQTTTATPDPGNRRTGVAEVDAVIDVIESGDVPAFMALLERFPEACAANPQGVGSPPRCPDGTPDGGTVQTFRWLASERGYEEQLQGVVTNRLARSPKLYAAYEASSQIFAHVPRGDYSLVFMADDGGPHLIEVTAGRIIGAWFGQNENSLQRMLEGVSAFLVPPASALATPTPMPSPTDSGYPLSRRTGVGEVDIVLNALESQNAARIASHFELIEMGCITEPVGIPSPPFCGPGVPAGTPVEVFPFASCEGSFADANARLALAQRVAEPNVKLLAVYSQGQPAPNFGDDRFPGGTHVIVLNQGGNGAELHVGNGGNILTIWFHCVGPAEDMIKDVPTSAFVLPPP